MQAPVGHPQASAVKLGEVHRTLGASSAAMVRIVRNLAEVRILIVGKAQILSIADPVETVVGVFLPKAPWSVRRLTDTPRHFGQVSLFATSEFVRRLARNDIEYVNQ